MSGWQHGASSASSTDPDAPAAVLCKMSVPRLDALYAFTASIDRDDLRDPSARSDFHWQTFKCRLVIFSLPVLACPVRLPGSPLRDITVICRREDLDENLREDLREDAASPLRAKLAALRLALSRLRPASSAEYAACLEYALAARLAPLWNPVADFLVRGRDFLTAGKLTDAVRLQVNVCGEKGEAWISIYPSRIRIAPLDMGDMDVSVPVLARFQDSPLGEVPATCIGNPWVNVLPSLKRGMVTSITKTIPPECPFQEYRDFRRHWKNMYGYRLPDADGGLPYVSVYFERLGKPMCYPWLCLTPQRPCSLRARDPPAVAAAFFGDVASRMPTVCRFPAPLTLDGGLVQPVAALCAVRGLRLDGADEQQPNLRPYQPPRPGTSSPPPSSRQDDDALTCPLSMATQRNGTRPYVEWNISGAQRRRPPPAEDDDEDKENRPPEDYQPPAPQLRQPPPPPPPHRPVFRSRPPVPAAARPAVLGGMTWFRPTSSSSPVRAPSTGRPASATRSPATSRTSERSCSPGPDHGAAPDRSPAAAPHRGGESSAAVVVPTFRVPAHKPIFLSKFKPTPTPAAKAKARTPGDAGSARPAKATASGASDSASPSVARKASAAKRPSSEPLPIPELRTADACRRASIPMLLAWLRSQGVPCRTKDKKGDLVDKAIARITQMERQHAG